MLSIVLGANGQDGSYLCEKLLLLGHSVIGIGRDATSRYLPEQEGFCYVCLDAADLAKLTELLLAARPDNFYHFAAVHGATGSGFTYEAAWAAMMHVNVLALHAAMEVARTCLPHMRIIYASSSKIFLPSMTGMVDESTPIGASCLYSIGKIAARDLMAQYRRDHGIETTNLIFFNHDSPRRSQGYLLADIAKTIALARAGASSLLSLRTLNFWIDWGSAEEFMAIVAHLGTKPLVPDLVIASGTTVFARDVVTSAFARHGLAIGAHIVEERPTAELRARFDVSLTRLAAIAPLPKVGVAQVIDSMVDAYLGG
ncbi:GDP-mannose 4,6-dehydratase [uncultured Devosia sp.]|uniref:GDP-mannose 4,6-dehydratase n=1 Tax=uncultured Devosia sp. TaxID=211434 RepID=UPI0035C9C9C5